MTKLLALTAALVAALAAPATGGSNHATCLGARSTIDGTSAGETIYGTPYADVVAAFGGADAVHARAGNDRVCAGSGFDAIYDGFGADQIDGGDGFDTLYLCPDGSRDVWFDVERVVQTSIGCH